MTSLSVQLHAAPDELAAFIDDVAKELGLHIVLFRFLPSFSCELVADSRKLADVMDLKQGQQVVLLAASPKLIGSNQLQFYDHNPEFISFHFGKWLPQGLGQSSMGCKSEDEATISIAKEIAKRLKKVSKAGVVITNPNSGASALSKTFRYTAGALALEQAGVQMLPIGGNLAKLDA